MRSLFLIIIFCSISNFSQAQNFNKADFHLFLEVQKEFESNHISYTELSPLINDRARERFPSLLDNWGEFLLSSDVQELKSSFPNFDQKNESKIDAFLEGAFEIYKSRLYERLKYLKTFDRQDFFHNDSIYLIAKPNTVLFKDDTQELNRYWLRYIKYTTLGRHHQDTILIGKSNPEINQILNSNMEEVLDKEICRIESLIQFEKLKEEILISFVRSYARSFDPHSDYLSESEVESFVASLSTERLGTGLVFRKQSTKYEVVEKTPFSSADFNKSIAVGDEILSIKSKSSFQPIACIDPIELEQLLHGYENQYVTFEIKSIKDKKIRVFTLEKTYLNGSENHTYSYLIKGDSSQFGYVQFPGFYSNLDGISRSSSQDMALILLKMRKTDNNGLIIDLRGNGGGSVLEAFDLISYFIDYGPLHIIKNSENQQGQLIKDGKRGKLIDTKVIFVVDALTASASEILITSLQKYPNFLVVGSKTFGKATGYKPIPITLPYSKKTSGMALVTNLKVYDLNGKTYQTEGVSPDISIPSFHSNQLISESLLHNPLPNDQIAKSFKPISSRREPIDLLANNSQTRIENDTVFQQIQKRKDYLIEVIKTPFYQSLHFRNYKNLITEVFNTEIVSKETFYDVISLEENEVFREKSDALKKTLEDDPILKEVFQIFEDWILLTSN